MNAEFSIEVRFYRLSPELQRYFTALYVFDLKSSDGQLIEDYLHPEWAAMRFFTRGDPPVGAIGPGELERKWPFVVSGPTSQSLHFGLATSLVWGLGLLPAGWAKFVNAPARDYADRIVDGSSDPAFQLFAPIQAMVDRPDVTFDTGAEVINAYLMDQLDRTTPQEDLVVACHDALRDPDVANVGELAERLGLGARSLERLCARYFGFPPKQMLRRQRFLRSLAKFTLTTGTSWSDALDEQYYDQAQFVRDFRSFMGMTPSEYAEAPHPIMDKIMPQRMADQGAAPQTDLPTVLRYGTDPAPKSE